MQILGIGDHVNCGSAIVRDGQLISAINDERLVREKMVFGVPRESIKMNLQLHNIKPSEIDAVAVGTENQHFIDGYVDFRNGWFGLNRGGFKQSLFKTASKVSKYRQQIPFMDDTYYLLRQPAFRNRRSQLKKILRQEFGLDCPVYFMDHHFCHATSAYYTSGLEKATIVTIDGGGDAKSGKVYDVDDGRFAELQSISSFDSLGAFYSYITQICGFKAGRHEGKITGLAAHGKPIYVPILQKFLVEKDGNIHNTANVFFLSALEEIERALPEDFSHKDLAASIQAYTEEMVVKLVTYWLERTKHFDVALSGGLFANVKINQRIHEIPSVTSIYVHPGMGDEGMPVGAALGLHYQLSEAEYDPDLVTMNHVYLGPEYCDDEIHQELDKQGVTATYYNNVETEIARLLTDGAVVARFNGKMEYGPRALGNRTILYQATDPTVNYWMNDALKRTEFMPFAPIVMTEHASKCFKHVDGAVNTARFMTITFDCTDWMASTCPGVVHVDNTARPQLVSKSDNPSMYRILADYYKLSGIPVLINTSFNMHEEPIVCTPSEAIRAFLVGHLDYLAIGNWIAKNPQPVERRTDPSRLEKYITRKGMVKS